ncbi:unnamed protein product [Ambrosiozyma monospora]|uniref:Unnamed protein product n=1 Tax=Ambrosiozyma monospora TaxID=43982 RepID=A0ACB5TV33_AMBMO|nr:unnamed protein product [Ambrosiozyma monospora]
MKMVNLMSLLFHWMTMILKKIWIHLVIVIIMICQWILKLCWMKTLNPTSNASSILKTAFDNYSIDLQNFQLDSPEFSKVTLEEAFNNSTSDLSSGLTATGTGTRNGSGTVIGTGITTNDSHVDLEKKAKLFETAQKLQSVTRAAKGDNDINSIHTTHTQLQKQNTNQSHIDQRLHDNLPPSPPHVPAPVLAPAPLKSVAAMPDPMLYEIKQDDRFDIVSTKQYILFDTPINYSLVERRDLKKKSSPDDLSHFKVFDDDISHERFQADMEGSDTDNDNDANDEFSVTTEDTVSSTDNKIHSLKAEDLMKRINCSSVFTTNSVTRQQRTSLYFTP